MSKPIKIFRGGQLELAIYENEIDMNGKKVKVRNLQLLKRYKDSAGEWKTTHTNNANETAIAELLFSKAREYLYLKDDTKLREDSPKDTATG